MNIRNIMILCCYSIVLSNIYAMNTKKQITKDDIPLHKLMFIKPIKRKNINIETLPSGHLPTGYLVAIEGIKKSGKTTLARNLYIAFMSDWIMTTVTGQSNSTELGVKLTDIEKNTKNSMRCFGQFLISAGIQEERYYK